MPELPISDGAGKLIPFAPAIVMARMFNPQSEEAYLQTLAWSFVALLVAHGRGVEDEGKEPEEEDLSVPLDVLDALLTAPSFEHMASIQLAALEGAYTAAQTLAFILSCRVHHPELRPGASRAWDVYSAYIQLKNKEEGAKASSSFQFVKREWAKYKPVLHLWTAQAALFASSEEGDFLPPRLLTPNAEAELLELLAHAEPIRRMAENTFAKGETTPILKPAESWYCPKDLELPVVESEVLPLPPEMLPLLKRRARRSR